MIGGARIPGPSAEAEAEFERYFAATSAGGCQVPSPAGRIEGGSVFGQ